MKYLKFSLILIALIGAFFAGWRLKPADFGARSVSGLPGVYNATDLNLTDGEGAGIALDAYGRVKVSTTTNLNVITP